MTPPFRIALTADFFSDGQLIYPDFDLSVLDDTPGLEYFPFSENSSEIASDQLAGANGVIVLTPAVTRQSLANSEELLGICRFGVGYEKVDVDACTEADVAMAITKGAVDRPVAEATVGWMIALCHHARSKDRLVREGRWHDRNDFMGSELRNRTMGVIGFGGIARELVRLLSGFGMERTLIYDPFIDDEAAAAAGVEKVELDDLLKQSDFISIHCPLTDTTTNLITARELALLKPTAYLINTARGGIVDEDALYASLSEGRIAGAALDCFVGEPVTTPSQFSEFDNVILAPHSIAWTHELFRDIGRSVCQSMIDLANGRIPHGVVNPEVFERPSFQEKWKRLAVTEELAGEELASGSGSPKAN